MRVRRLVGGIARAFWEWILIVIDPILYARVLGVRVGKDCRFLGITRETFGSEPYLIRIGDHVTVTSGVRFITHDGGVWVFREEEPDIEVFGPIEVGRNVFIGVDAIILPGVKIGESSVIAAGSVVTRDVPPRSVAAGVPARVLKDVNEYRRAIEGRATRIRSLPPKKKRDYLVRRFLDTGQRGREN